MTQAHAQQAPLRGLRPWAALCLAAACRAPGDLPDPLPEPSFDPPGILSIELDCKLADGKWLLDIELDAWAGGAALFWTVDGSYVELHEGFRSIKSAPDGSGDTWRLELNIVDDFRPAGVEGNTAFTCNSEPSSLIWVNKLNRRVSDCRQLGPDPGPLLLREEAPACPDRWPPPVAEPEDSDPPGDDG